MSKRMTGAAVKDNKEPDKANGVSGRVEDAIISAKDTIERPAVTAIEQTTRFAGKASAKAVPGTVKPRRAVKTAQATVQAA